MYIYYQTTGQIWRNNTLMGSGYAGLGEGKNSHEMQGVPNVGPIPVGLYTIGPVQEKSRFGPCMLPLWPDQHNDMTGNTGKTKRSGFLIHADSIRQPGAASKGCIVLSEDIRRAIAAGRDRILVVVP